MILRIPLVAANCAGINALLLWIEDSHVLAVTLVLEFVLTDALDNFTRLDCVVVCY